ncbi:flagellar hook-associated protein FlgL [Edaphobacter aggregans]|uniref:flagellar hook-associated protein FlgL n=1 Tax=Edaphobacter aggregans TaxID=570835 RepID=UPI00055141AA|nr:flagellar hook-associated protein FlgL [Edaphobacter aggregans]
MRADPHYVSSLSQALNSATQATNDLASQLSSGLRVGALSDDPGAAAQSVQLRSQIARVDTYIQTAASQSSMLQVTGSTLGEVVSQLTSAISLAVQGANGTQNASNLQAITQQLTGVRDQVLALANTSYQGRYLFAGSQGSIIKPFSLDTTTTPATVTYSGDAVVQSIETPGGQQIQVNLPGSSIFGSGTSGALGALNQLIADFTSGVPAANLAADNAALTSALGQVSTQRSVLNSSLSTIQSTSNYAQTQEAQLKAQQSTLVAADPATVATQLKSTQVQYQALLSVVTALQKVNLFDYLK